MGKDGDLWDDSALINAFDDAILRYKTMNIKQGHCNSAEGGKDISDKGDDESGIHTRSSTPLRSSIAAETRQVDISNTAEEIREANNASRVKESLSEHIKLDEEEYNALLARYNELEEEKQKLVQKLRSYDIQYNYNVDPAWGTSSQQYSEPNAHPKYQNVSAVWGPPYQQFSVPYAHDNYPTGTYPHCSYTCPWMAPCCVDPACDIGRTVCNTSGGVVSDQSCQIENNDILKVATEAAKNAESITRTGTHLSSSGNRVTGKEDDRSVAQTSSQGTDLLTVLNAWYTAGLYTGKYLTEQSYARK